TDNIRHLHLSGADNILCVDQLKMGLLAKSCLMPGMAAFICSIIFTFKQYSGPKNDFWVSEFLTGCSHHIYEVSIPSFLNGLLSFSFLAYFLYFEYEFVAIGVCEDNYYRLFPAERMVTRNMVIFVLSKSPECKHTIDTISLSTLSK
ncbi:hypothetical protein THRCLA_22081, partial [Thraustotheca clavata]